MHVGLGVQARELVGLVLRPHLRPADEEALLRRDCVGLRERSAGYALLLRHPREEKAAAVADVPAERQVAVRRHIHYGGVSSVLLHDAGGSFSVTLTIRRHPPVA